MKQKYAVVTGGTKGIGRAVSEKLLKNGYRVFAVYASDDAAAEKFMEDSFSYKDRISLIKCDLSTRENADLLIKTVLKSTGCLDCIILNAGATDRTPFDEITYEKWEYVVNTNVNVPFYLVHEFKPHIAKETGRIIFIGSVCGVYPHSVSPAYGVTKAACHQMAKELVKFFADDGITVNAIIPGFTDTPRQKSKAPEHRERIENKIALGRFACSEEIADLCMEVIRNQYINGANLVIDGGYSYR